MSAEHVVVRLSNSQVALLASALNPRKLERRIGQSDEQEELRRASVYERWLRDRQAGVRVDPEEEP